MLQLWFISNGPCHILYFTPMARHRVHLGKVHVTLQWQILDFLKMGDGWVGGGGGGGGTNLG